MTPALRVSPSGTAACVAGDGELPRQAKTRRGKRALQEREPQEHEEVKRLLLLRGTRASASVQQILADLRDMKKPHVVYLRSVRRCREGTQQHAFHPFEDVSSGEFLCEKNNCGFFCLGSTSKKRPARLVFARMFSHQLLDMYELQVSLYTPASAFRGKEKPHVGSTPIILLQGAHFEADEVLKGLRNFFADFFRGSAVASHVGGMAAFSAAKQQQLYLAGLDRVIAITALEPSAQEAVAEAERAQAAAAATLQHALQNAMRRDTTAAGAADAEAQEEQEADEGGCAAGEAAGELSAAGGAQTTAGNHAQVEGGKALICLRQYRVVMKKGSLGNNEPRVELEEVGPQIDMQYRLAAADRWKRATVCRAAATAAQRKQREAAAGAVTAAGSPAARRGAAVAASAAAAQKNKKKRKTTTTALGDVVGRVYVDKPDWRSLNAQKNVLLIKHNRKRAKLTAEATTATAPAESPTAAPAKRTAVEKGAVA